MTNFQAACRSLEASGAALRKETPQEIEETLVDLAMDPERRRAMGERGVSWHQANRGAVTRTVSAITRCLTDFSWA